MKFAVLPMTALFAAGCGANAAQSSDEFSSTDPGAETMRAFDLTGFDAIALEGPFTTSVNIGDEFSVRAEGDPEILERLEIETVEGQLRIGKDDDYEWHRDYGRVRVFVTMPLVQSASVAGSGDMTVEAMEGADFSASIAGSGDLVIGTITGTNGTLSIAGSGDMSAAGTAQSLEVSIAGSGDIAIPDLRAETMDASVTGSGTVEAYVTGNVTASFVGSGDVSVRGGAQCRSTQIGSGRLNCN